MDTLKVIWSRRSIRKFRPDEVSQALLEEILEAALQAPSGKNRQPWHLIVVQGEARGEFLRLIRDGIDYCVSQDWNVGSAENSLRIMAEAPVTIFVLNQASREYQEGDRWDLVDVQSIGGMIQTLLLAAEARGLGSLWICDVFYGGSPLEEWLAPGEQLVAAVSLGYPDEAPPSRPRKSVEEVVEWRG